jgi:hypothetical protein
MSILCHIFFISCAQSNLHAVQEEFVELLSLLGCFAIPILVVIVIVLVVLFIWMLKRNAQKFKQQRQEKITALRKKGVTAPAVIHSARNGVAQGPNNDLRLQVTFDVEVQPEGRSTFQTKFTDWLEISQYEGFMAGADRPKDVGRKIWVTYDPNDLTQIMFEYYDEDRKYRVGRPIFEQMERRNKSIRETGREALALVLEAEDLELANLIEKDHLQQTIMRLKLEITPENQESYKAETQALIANASLPKYAVGKKVYIKFNPQDRTQVALLRSAEG